VVFQLDQAPGDWRPAFAYQLAEDDLPPESAAFAEELVALVQDHRPVERGVLRLGAAELLWRRQDPKAVTLDEAVGLAKELGGQDAASFVNGVLGRLARDAV
jgi:N utilization substance protein B